MNVPKAALYGTGMIVGLIGLGVLVTVKILEDVARRNGWR